MTSGMDSTQLLMHAQRLQAIAQSGITYATTPYDLELYEEIRAIVSNYFANSPMKHSRRSSAYSLPRRDIERRRSILGPCCFGQDPKSCW